MADHGGRGWHGAHPHQKIAAVALASFHGSAAVDHALASAAELGRFADEDLGQLLRYQSVARPGAVQ